MKKAIARQRQSGFLVIAAVFLLVVLGGLVAYLATVSTTSQAASAADFNSARAYQAARAGIERGAYEILRNPTGSFATSTCTGGAPTSVTLTFGADFTAKVTCTSTTTSEGASSSVIAYRIVSNGCNQPSCPSVSTSSTYAERELALTITN